MTQPPRDWGLTLGARCYRVRIGRALYARLLKADMRLARAPKSSPNRIATKLRDATTLVNARATALW
jgi:hypothetical protein